MFTLFRSLPPQGVIKTTMKKILYTLLLAVALSPLTTQAQSPTAPALNFNVFLQNNSTLINNETEGPYALGGDLTIGGGYQVSTNYPGTFFVDGIRVTMLIGGRVNYSSGTLQVNQNGYIKIGNCLGSNVWYTDPNGAHPPIRITHGTDYNGSPRILLQQSDLYFGASASVKPVCQGGIVDFNSAFTTMRAYSDTMSLYADNANVTNSGGTPIPHTGLPSQIKVTMHAGLNVLNVTGADLNNVTDFIYNNSPSAGQYFVINVNAPGTFNWAVPNSGGIGFYQCPYILWNFYNTTTLNIVGYGAVEGTVFAPRADINKSVNMANIEGQIIAKSYHHAGGENHYAVFAPSLPGCGGPTPPAAGYTVNSSTQCLVCNSFVFTNTSTGSPTLTYLWSFGDGTTSTAMAPTKVYTAVGTYSVKLRVTNSAGTDSVTHTVTVASNPAHGFTVNDSSQALTGNNFVFTSTTPTFGNLYSWSFGDGSTATGPNPTRTYSVAGVYTVTQSATGPGGCSVITPMVVTVETDSVGGGGGGGLESESLGDLVSKREYNKMKHSISKYVDYSTLPVFNKQTAAYAASKGTAEVASCMQRFVPTSLDANTVGRITTPEDLKTITAAVDVFSVDYTRNEVPKAVVLGIATTGKPYNHTKSICDRFRGATLLGTRLITINGYKLIEFALRQGNGQIEHSITFAAGKSTTLAAYRLQAKWLISEYVQDDSVFNFQVWGTTPESAEKLAKDIITNLQGEMPVQQIDNEVVTPKAFLASGKRDREFIDVTINSVEQSFNARMIFFQKRNELSTEDSLIIPFYIAAGGDNKFRIPIYDGYEYDGHLYLNDTLVDNVYMADGNWSLDYDKTYTEIVNYKPDNEPNREYAEDEYPVYRSVKVAANTTDYISLYKFIHAGQEKTDLSKYNSYKFFAKGEGKMDVILLKESVTRFADQYKTTVKLNPAGANYQIGFSDFTSANLSTPFDASDVKAVVYQFTFDGVATDFNFEAGKQSFSPAEVPSIKALSSKVVTVFPNPAAGKFQVKFLSEEVRDMDITLTDMTGKLVYKMSVTAAMGQNVVDITLPSTMPQTLMFVQVGNKEVKYNITKLSVLK